MRLSALRYQGLDTVGHYNLRYTQPRDVGGANEEERRRRLQVFDRYYGDIDGEIGDGDRRAASRAICCSSSRASACSRRSRSSACSARVLRDPMSGTHERAPDGFLLAYGTAVEPGRHQRGSIVDVTPTVLYFLGLPVGRDMDGYARADLFTQRVHSGAADCVHSDAQSVNRATVDSRCSAVAVDCLVGSHSRSRSQRRYLSADCDSTVELMTPRLETVDCDSTTADSRL